MRTNPYKTYVEDEILTADPVKLVQLMYRGAVEAVTTARASLAAGDIKARSVGITKTIEILAELASSLDHKQGGELSERLAALYDYMQRRLIDANTQQADSPLAEVQQILITLEEAWCAVEAPVAEAAGRKTRYREDGESAPNRMAPADYVPLSCAY